MKKTQLDLVVERLENGTWFLRVLPAWDDPKDTGIVVYVHGGFVIETPNYSVSVCYYPAGLELMEYQVTVILKGGYGLLSSKGIVKSEELARAIGQAIQFKTSHWSRPPTVTWEVDA